MRDLDDKSHCRDVRRVRCKVVRRIMRLIPTLLVAVCCMSCRHSHPMQVPLPSQVAPAPGAPDSRWLFESRFAGVTYEFAVSDAFLHRTSKWNAETDPLPCPPSRAVQAALEEARRLQPEVNHWSTEEVVLRPVGDTCWYYEVLLLRGDQVIIGIPPSDFFLKIPVLMSGAAVHPLPIR